MQAAMAGMSKLFEVPYVACKQSCAMNLDNTMEALATTTPLKHSACIRFELTDFNTQSESMYRVFTGLGLLSPEWEDFLAHCEPGREYTVGIAVDPVQLLDANVNAAVSAAPPALSSAHHAESTDASTDPLKKRRSTHQQDREQLQQKLLRQQEMQRNGGLVMLPAIEHVTGLTTILHDASPPEKAGGSNRRGGGANAGAVTIGNVTMNVCLIKVLDTVLLSTLQQQSKQKQLNAQINKQSATSAVVFSPSLAKQRINLIVLLLNQYQALSWIDLGCGESKVCLSSFVDATAAKALMYALANNANGENAMQIADEASVSSHAANASKKPTETTELGEDCETTAPVGATHNSAAVQTQLSIHNVGNAVLPESVREFIGVDLTDDNIRIAAKNMKLLSDCVQMAKDTTADASPPSLLSTCQLQSLEVSVMSLLNIPALFAPDAAHSAQMTLKFVDADMITSIEVIEHLPCIQDAIDSTVSVLTHLHPKHFFVSTPNYEANVHIARAAAGYNSVNDADIVAAYTTTIAKTTAVASSLGSLCKNPANNPSQRLLRESDHKFEFTRAEFKDYVDLSLDLANGSSCMTSSLGGCGCMYTATYFDVGTTLQGMDASGGATQCVLFARSNAICESCVMKKARANDVVRADVEAKAVGLKDHPQENIASMVVDAMRNYSNASVSHILNSFATDDHTNRDGTDNQNSGPRVVPYWSWKAQTAANGGGGDDGPPPPPLLATESAGDGVCGVPPPVLLLEDPPVTCFLAWPNSTARQRAAKLREHKVSPKL
jgi:hypothetical protein